MNKKFLNLMICSLLTGSMATGFVSCKDYDDDITEINTTTDGLAQQLKDLNAALQTANADAAAAKAAADAAKAAADAASDDATKAIEAANAAAAEANAAAAEAKAEALKEVIAQAEALQKQINANANLTKENAEAIAALAGRINGIEQGLANIDLTDINKQLGEQANLIAEANKQIQAIQTQIKALEIYGDQIKALNSDVEDIKAQLAAIDAIKSDLKALGEKAEANAKDIKANADAISANTAAINDVKAQLTQLSAKISTEVANAINTIAGVISQRLTSVTLMPDLYVGGIPTIDFESALYTKQVFKNNKWQNATGSNIDFIVSNDETEAEYRLNPGTVTNEDIVRTELAFVSRIATARSAETVNDLIHVADANISGDGILSLKLGKSNTASLNRTDGKINTVALRVPIADKHLFKEQGETEAYVYSEYTRLEESYFKPEIIYVPGANLDKATNTHPYVDSLAVYNSAADAAIAKTIVYNSTYNLYELIEGCKFFTSPDKHVAIDMDQLRKYGMEIKFAVATRAYEPTTEDKTDQQKWVKLSGENNEFLTPITSNNIQNNEAIIGKQPIIRATLSDEVNHNVIDVRYFKVKFTAVEMQPVKLPWPDIETNGTPCNGASVDMTWDEVAKNILVQLNGGNGMSKEDFNKIYGTNFTIDPANDNNGKFTINIVNEPSASIPVFSWSVSAEQLGKLKEGDNTANFKKTVTFTNPAGLYPDVVIEFNWTVNTKVGAVTLGNTDNVKWADNTMLVYVVPMEIPYVSGTSPKAHYATNILEGRLKPYVNGLTSCASYDIDFAAGQGYVGKPLEFQNPFGHWAMTSANQKDLNTVTYSIDNDANGKALASNGKTIKVNWSSDINGLPNNRYVFGTVNLKVLPILKLNPENAKAINDNSAVQSTDVAVTITDAYGNLVAQTATASAPHAADYWDFYGVEEPTFNGKIMIADDANGKNERSLESLNMTADVDAAGKLTFQNNGSPIQADAYLMVPVQVNHLWGTLTGKVAVPLKKANL